MKLFFYSVVCTFFLSFCVDKSTTENKDSFSGKSFVLNREHGTYNSPYLNDSTMTTLLFVDANKCIAISQQFSNDFISGGTYSLSEDIITLHLDTFQVTFSSGYKENGPVISAVTYPTITVQYTGKRESELKIFRHEKEILLLPQNEKALLYDSSAFESNMKWLEGEEILELLKNPKFKTRYQELTQ